uniref:Uncharacterized protein n=1 Tax=Cacopsylla melanoneura TaxID=428564 RepID=A0A8D8VQ98_9HEMI
MLKFMLYQNTGQCLVHLGFNIQEFSKRPRPLSIMPKLAKKKSYALATSFYTSIWFHPIFSSQVISPSSPSPPPLLALFCSPSQRREVFLSVHSFQRKMKLQCCQTHSAVLQ